MRSSFLALGVALFGATTIIAQSNAPSCYLNKKCPEEAPCCSQYNECGVGAFCLGGCDPRMSFSLDSCVPKPVCEDRKMRMNSMDGITDISKYLGDPSKADWVASGEPVVSGGNVLLTMSEGTVGTVLSSTVYMWYGTVKARMKTSKGAGVITGFILFSDVQDEIDYEWVGVDLETSQTNFYFQGIPDYTHSENLTMSDSFKEWHEYEIRWTPDEIVWLIDGEEGRTVKKSDTYNKTANQWDFPQTPARVQLSLWPGGLPDNPKGTIDWAGGVITWDKADMNGADYYYAQVSDVEIECWDGRRGEAGSNHGKSFTYDSWLGTNDTVRVGNNDTTIKNLSGTGLDPGEDEEESTRSSDSSRPSASSDADEPQSIPGGTNPGNTNPGSEDEEGDSSNNNNNNNGGGGGGGNSGNSDTGNTEDSNGCDALDFNQDTENCGGSDSSSQTEGQDSGAGAQERTAVGASAFAALVAVAGLFWI